MYYLTVMRSLDIEQSPGTMAIRAQLSVFRLASLVLGCQQPAPDRPDWAIKSSALDNK